MRTQPASRGRTRCNGSLLVAVQADEPAGWQMQRRGSDRSIRPARERLPFFEQAAVGRGRNAARERCQNGTAGEPPLPIRHR